MNCNPVAMADDPEIGPKLAGQLYGEVITVPYMAKFLVFAKRQDEKHGLLRVFVVTDDKLDKTLESHQRFLEVARSDDVEVSRGVVLSTFVYLYTSSSLFSQFAGLASHLLSHFFNHFFITQSSDVSG